MKKTKEKPLVLIVEDSAVEAEIIKRSVTRGGYEVAIARNGFDGLDSMMSRKPAIVLSDINMPLMNGFEMCAAIREKKDLTDIPVILISALSDPEDVIMAITAGADGYITKPYDEDTLLSRIEALIRVPGEKRGETGETMDIEYNGKLFTVPVNYRQQMNILLSVYENLISQNHQLTNVQVQLTLLNERLDEKVAERTVSLTKEIEERAKTEEALRESKKRLDEAQHIGKLGFLDWDLITNEIEVSDETLRIYGLDTGKKELKLEEIVKLVHPDDVDIAVQSLNNAIEKGLKHHIEHRIVRPDGKVVYLDTRGEIFRDANGKPIRMLGTNIDITDRKRTEIALQESEVRYRAVMETANDAMICINPNGKVHMWNRKAEEMFGYTEQEAMGMDVHDLIVPVKYLEQARAGLTKFETTGDGPVINKTTEITALRRNGSEFPIELSLAAVKMKDGWGASAIIRDITERKALFVRLETLNRALRMLSECNQELIQAKDEKQLLDNICRVITEVGGYRMAWIGFAEHDEAKTVKPVASSGYDEGYVEMLNITWADTERGRGPTGTAIRANKPLVCRNIATDPLFALWRAEALNRSYVSSVALPLTDGEAVMGALNIYSEDPNAFGAEEMRLLTELANDLSFGIIHLRMQKERERLQRDIAETHRIAHIGSYVWDAKSDIAQWDDEMYNIFGVRRGEFQPSLKLVSEMIHPDDRALALESIRISLEETGQYERKYRIVRPDGSMRHIHAQGESRRNEKGEPVGLIGTLTDVTAQKEWEITLVETNQKLQQALDDINKTQKMLIRSEKLAALGQLSAGVGHELKNPLNIISTSTQLMMMEEGLPAEVMESGKTIMEQVMRAVKIIDNLREFARERKPERKGIGLCPFIEKTMGLVAYEMKGEGIEIATECPPEPVWIMGDEDQLAQVFLNITNNARDSMKTRRNSYSIEERTLIGWKARLTVRTRVEDGKAKICFEDNGVGISEKNKLKLFTPFFTTKGESTGTGLGIAIAFGIIENHGGTIEFESEEGKGAAFTVTLPLAS